MMNNDKPLSGEQVITGIVNPMEVWGSSRGYGEPITWSFRLYNWRDQNGNIHDESLSIIIKEQVKSKKKGKPLEERRQEEHQLRQEAEEFSTNNPIFEKIKAYNVIKVKVDFSSSIKRKLVEIIDDNYQDDEELNQIAQKSREPIRFEEQTLEHKIFGTFTFDKFTYETDMVWAGQDITLWWSGDDDELKVAIKLWQNQHEWDEKARHFAAEELVEFVYEDAKPVTIEQFKERITLYSIAVDSDGRFNLEYDDGWLFGGHHIVVKGNLTDGIQEILP